MTKKLHNIVNILIIALILIVNGSCKFQNRFKKNDFIHVFSFGIMGYDDFEYCNKINQKFIDPYKNGINPSKTCLHYQYYNCHVNHYCKKDKSCEKEAALYWLKPWRDTKTRKLLDPIITTKRICEKEAERNNK